MSNPLSFLPLTPFAFHVLLALADGERHGYGIMKEVEERSGGTVTLRTGTLYTLLQRLVDESLITEATMPPGAEKGDDRRRYYELSPLGHEVLRAEARRLEALINDAKRKHVLSDTTGV
ncbi:MAG: PadR family transcriptional regulator [Vicinamibacterales bacterium]